MAYTDHLEVYQSFSTEELTEEVTRLKTARKGYLSQSAGSKAYTQDLRRVDDMLRAAVRVQNERGSSVSTAAGSRGTVNFSGY
jgi:hypothetical protein